MDEETKEVEGATTKNPENGIAIKKAEITRAKEQCLFGIVEQLEKDLKELEEVD